MPPRGSCRLRRRRQADPGTAPGARPRTPPSPDQVLLHRGCQPVHAWGITVIYKDLIADEQRTRDLVADVAAALSRGRNCLVLTNWTAHLDRRVIQVGIAAHIARLRAVVGHELLLVPSVSVLPVDDKAYGVLRAAQSAAPQEITARPVVRSLVRDLVTIAPPSIRREAGEFAAQLGLYP